MQAPKTVTVVGAGVIGLSTAWYLQQAGVDVTVVDRAGPTVGSSWGNAGWVTPGLAAPLGEPSTLRYGLTSLLDPDAALRVPPRLDPGLWLFLGRFAARCTHRAWTRAASRLVTLNRSAFSAFDELAAGGVDASATETSILAAFEDERSASGMRDELRHLGGLGGGLSWRVLHGPEARVLAPQISTLLPYVMELGGQRFLDPGRFVAALETAVADRGAKVIRGVDVRSIRRENRRLTLECTGADLAPVDAVVLATGAWMSELGRHVGIKTQVESGRGYSFDVATDLPAEVPIYLPGARVACTPLRGRLRIAGTMEFLPPDSPLDERRIDSIIRSVRPLLEGVDWTSRTNEWVGARPVTSDGLPIIGETVMPEVYAAGGHGMWGMTLGPATGRLLADRIVGGCSHQVDGAFSPRRR